MSEGYSIPADQARSGLNSDLAGLESSGALNVSGGVDLSGPPLMSSAMWIQPDMSAIDDRDALNDDHILGDNLDYFSSALNFLSSPSSDNQDLGCRRVSTARLELELRSLERPLVHSVETAQEVAQPSTGETSSAHRHSYVQPDDLFTYGSTASPQAGPQQEHEEPSKLSPRPNPEPEPESKQDGSQTDAMPTPRCSSGPLRLDRILD